MTSEDLKRRTFEFGRLIILFCGPLFDRPRTWKIADQLQAAGTSVGANYRAVCCARSRAEFVAKVGTVIEESDESDYWLAQLIATDLVSEEPAASLKREALELKAIFVASRRTAGGDKGGRPRR